MWIYSRPEYRESLEIAYQSVPELKKLSQASIMITGARGLIGSFLTDLLLYCIECKGYECQIYATGRDIKRLENRFEGWKIKERLHLLHYELGLTDGMVGFPAKVDYIIHCAGSGSPSVFMERPAEFVKNTVAGAYDILDYARTAGTKKKPVHIKWGNIRLRKNGCGCLWRGRYRICGPSFATLLLPCSEKNSGKHMDFLWKRKKYQDNNCQGKPYIWPNRVTGGVQDSRLVYGCGIT